MQQLHRHKGSSMHAKILLDGHSKQLSLKKVLAEVSKAWVWIYPLQPVLTLFYYFILLTGSFDHLWSLVCELIPVTLEQLVTWTTKERKNKTGNLIFPPSLWEKTCQCTLGTHQQLELVAFSNHFYVCLEHSPPENAIQSKGKPGCRKMSFSRTFYNWENKKQNPCTMAEYFTLTFLKCNTDYFILKLFVSKNIWYWSNCSPAGKSTSWIFFNWNLVWQTQTEIVKNILFIYFFLGNCQNAIFCSV